MDGCDWRGFFQSSYSTPNARPGANTDGVRYKT
jgi:hypothetical protein